MANHKSAAKRHRRSLTRTTMNHARITRIRTYVKKVEMAIAAGDSAAAQDALKKAVPELMRGGQHGVLHRNTASRKISRLNARVKAMAA